MSGKTRSGAGRTDRRYRKLREQFRDHCEENNTPCWMCGQLIDWQAPKDEPDCFNLDHFYPVSTHPDLGNDPANFRCSHRACNLARSDGDPPLSIGSLSEDW